MCHCVRSQQCGDFQESDVSRAKITMSTRQESGDGQNNLHQHLHTLSQSRDFDGKLQDARSSGSGESDGGEERAEKPESAGPRLPIVPAIALNLA